jgi:hypothetical protein
LDIRGMANVFPKSVGPGCAVAAMGALIYRTPPVAERKGQRAKIAGGALKRNTHGKSLETLGRFALFHSVL